MTVIIRSENTKLGISKNGNLPHTEQKILTSCSLAKDTERLREILVSDEVE